MGSNVGFPLPNTVVLRSRKIQPKLNGTGKFAPLIFVRWAAAGKGMISTPGVPREPPSAWSFRCVELAGRGLYRIYRERATGVWYADGIYD